VTKTITLLTAQVLGIARQMAKAIALVDGESLSASPT
jgi:hypothetical protein